MHIFCKIKKLLQKFDYGTICQSLIKTTFLLFLNSIPVIIAVLLQQYNSSEENGFFHKCLETVTVPELFIYCTSYLVPFIYFMFEKRKSEDCPPKIYSFYLFIAFLIYLFTAIAFAIIKSGSTDIENTYLYIGLHYYAYVICGFVIFCWYLTIYRDCKKDQTSIEKAKKIASEEQNKLSEDFSKRLNHQGTENE